MTTFKAFALPHLAARVSFSYFFYSKYVLPFCLGICLLDTYVNIGVHRSVLHIVAEWFSEALHRLLLAQFVDYNVFRPKTLRVLQTPHHKLPFYAVLLLLRNSFIRVV